MSAPGVSKGDTEALDCNSDIIIAQTPGATGVSGTPVAVTLDVESVLSTDTFDNPLPQVFDRVQYFRDCATTIPCVTNPNPETTVVFVGLTAGTTCAGTTLVDPNASPLVFDFVPDLTLGPSATPVSCRIAFDVLIPNPGTYTSEANTSGACQGAIVPLNSDTTVTDTLTIMPVVPTLGEAGLMVLTLALLAGSLLMLRRRQGVVG